MKKIFVLLSLLYATLAFAAVEVNTGTAADLDSIKGIGPGTSSRIIKERKKGEFKDWADFISRVKGIQRQERRQVLGQRPDGQWRCLHALGRRPGQGKPRQAGLRRQGCGPRWHASGNDRSTKRSGNRGQQALKQAPAGASPSAHGTPTRADFHCSITIISIAVRADP